MNIEIPCQLYYRISDIPLMLDPDDKRKYLKCIYLERKAGKLFVIATNAKIASVELLGDSAGPDECTAIVVDQALIDQCQKEIPFNSSLVIVANPALQFTTIKTKFGYNHPGNAMVQLPDANNFATWRKWFPDDVPKKSFGVMQWSSRQIYALANASPSSVLRFPEFIDTNVPVIIRDVENDNWVGAFNPLPLEGQCQPATVPDWL